MPQRSNEFQKLVFYITQQLASNGATVTESKMLWDPDTEQEREVDIFIEDSSGPYRVTVGIECTASKRKVDTPKLEQLYLKHRTLGIGQTVIVAILWLALFASKRRSEFHRLQQEYAHKEALAKSYQSYKKQIEDLRTEDQEMLKGLILKAINAVAYNASETLDKHHGDKTPAVDLANKILTGMKS